MRQSQRTVMESIGVYLPPKSVSTKEIVEGCTNKVLLPLERLTGIESRRVAGETEFGYDLAVKAVEDCLAHSKYGPEDIDLIVSCSISHFDGPDEYSFEPCRAVRLRKTFGMHDALAFDITNACAGMFTGIYLVESLIRAGEIRRGLVVSGEYITHLTKTAQQEIEGRTDPRLACLTLGDAGAAVLVDATTDPECGFHALELYTMGRHSSLCIAMVTDKPNGGAIMTTDMVNLANIAVSAFLQHSAFVVFQLGWSADQVDHVLPHQTSKTTLDSGSRAIKHLIAGRGLEFQNKLINVVANRGNTATTSHFVALRDCFLNGRIKSGESVVFGILASGITVGTAVYRFDDLPDLFSRRKPNGNGQPAPRPTPRIGCFVGRHPRPRIRIESVGILDPDRVSTADTLTMLTEASRNCLAESSYDPSDVDLLLSTGVYRTGYLSEPAIASLLAGLLKINDAPKTPVEKKSLAFDLLNSGGGFLNACHVASVLIQTQAQNRVMIAASEVENNAKVAPDCLRGIKETAAAVILDASDGETGFGAFYFRFFPDEAESLNVYGSTRKLRIGEWWVARLFVEKETDLERRIVRCVCATVSEFLEAEGIPREDIAVVLPPQISPAFISELYGKLKMERGKFVDISREGEDMFTSSMPHCLYHLRRSGRCPHTGALGLIINVAAGMEVGCAIYHF